MVKKYQKPTVTTIQIPERTAYACNLGGSIGCPQVSNVVGYGLCSPANGIHGIGQCN